MHCGACTGDLAGGNFKVSILLSHSPRTYWSISAAKERKLGHTVEAFGRQVVVGRRLALDRASLSWQFKQTRERYGRGHFWEPKLTSLISCWAWRWRMSTEIKQRASPSCFICHTKTQKPWHEMPQAVKLAAKTTKLKLWKQPSCLSSK